MKRLAVVALLSAGATATQADPLTVSGKVGYLSEWEIAANVVATITDGKGEFSGPFTLTHVGLCSANGPEVKSGEIRLRTSGLRSSQIEAVFELDGEQCTFRGALSKDYQGAMDCLGAKGVPASLSIK